MEPIKNPEVKFSKIFINNEWVDSSQGKTFKVINPSTEEVLCEVQEGFKEDVDKAVAAAKAAFEYGSVWRTTDADQRGRLLYKLAELLERDVAYLASLETADNGKPFLHAVGDVMFSAKTIRYYAGYADKICGSVIPADGQVFSYTRLEPIGVCAAIIPWNFPLLMAAWKLAPCLASGCVMVMKPAEQTPLTCLAFAELVKEAGIPAGVFNVVPGYGPTAGQALSTHADVDKVAFTGSTEVGALIMQAAAGSNLKGVTLEMGGKSPLVIFEDADLDKAVETAHQGVFANSGQVCCAATRTFVHEKIYDEFLKRCADRTKKRTVGDPFTEGIEQGPQVDDTQFVKVLGLINKGCSEGARLVCGGERQGEKGYFVQPTIFADVKDDMTIAKEEIFGPVMSVMKFSDMSEVIRRANATSYGLAAGVFTQDIDKAIEFSHAVRAGTVWVNCWNSVCTSTPFGGYKESGIGRELGEYGLRQYCEVKTVSVAIRNKNS